MSKLVVAWLFPILSVAQLTPNSVTVSASRNTTPRPDVARFYITISAPTAASIEDVVAVAAGAGVTAANFSGVSYYQNGATQPVNWSFSTTVPLADLKARIGALTALQNNLAKEKSFALSFSVDGTESSPAAQSCALPDLIADARAQAAKLASAAGMSVGGVLAISGAVTGSAATSSCSITVRFGLGGF